MILAFIIWQLLNKLPMVAIAGIQTRYTETFRRRFEFLDIAS